MERLVKGVHILPFCDFIHERYDDKRQRLIYDTIRPETLQMTKTIKRDEWRPAELVADLNAAIYSTSPSQQAGYDDIVAAGAASADYAAGTYVRLLIKLMTPKIMASKWPDIWKKSHNFGVMKPRLEGDRMLKLALTDVAGYTHIAPCAVGFLSFSLHAMGLPEAKVVQFDRDASPNSDHYEFEITW
jgi:hypothetical protein